jgi:hypothetical protein
VLILRHYAFHLYLVSLIFSVSLNFLVKELPIQFAHNLHSWSLDGFSFHFAIMVSKDVNVSTYRFHTQLQKRNIMYPFSCSHNSIAAEARLPYTDIDNVTIASDTH